MSLYLQSPQFAIDPGIGTHLATGRWILKTGSIPRSDPFTFSAEGLPWVADQWLSALLFWSGYILGGWSLLYAALQALYLGLLSFLLSPLIRRHVDSSIIAILALLYAFKLGEIHFVLRGVFFSYFFFCAYLAVLLVIDADLRAGRKPDWKRWMSILFPLTALWANLHPSFPIGLLLLGSACVGSMFYPKGKEALAGWMALSGAMLAATFCTPYGYELHRSIARTVTSTFAMSYYQEWQPPELLSATGIFLITGVVFIAVTYCSSRQYRKRLGFFLPVAVSVFAYLGIDALRMVPYYGFVACIPFGLALEELGRKCIGHKDSALARASHAIEQRERRAVSPRVSAAFLIVVLCVVGATGRYPGATGPEARYYPFAALSFLKKYSDPQKKQRVLNEIGWGGFLTFYGGRHRPFIDDRTSLFGDTFYNAFLSLYTGKTAYRTFLASYPIDYLFLNAEGVFAKQITEQVPEAVIYSDAQAIIADAGRIRDSYAIP